MSDDEKEPAPIRVAEIGPEPRKSLFPDYLAELQRMTGAEIGVKLAAGPIVFGVDVARDPDVISFVVGRRGPNDSIEFIDADQITTTTRRMDPIWKDECSDIPEWIREELGKRMRARADDMVREIIMRPVSSRMSDHALRLFDESIRSLERGPVWWDPDKTEWPKWSAEMRARGAHWARVKNALVVTDGSLGRPDPLPVERPPLQPALTPGDTERLRLAEEKRKRKAAKRKGRL